MTVAPKYLNGLADKAGCMDTNIEVYSVTRITNLAVEKILETGKNSGNFCPL